MSDGWADGGAFGAWLRGELDARGWTAVALARRSGAEASAVRAWLAGTTLPRRRGAVRLAEALGNDPDEVLRLAGLAPDRGRLRDEGGGDG